MHHIKGFKVRAIKSDWEFEDLVEPFATPEPDIDMNITARDEHVGEIERIIIVVKEWTRATHARLQHKRSRKW